MNSQKYILLTIDVEDWFQVENFRPWIPFETWDQHELRVERNVHRLLNLFDSVKLAGRLEARSQKADVLERDEARKSESSKDSELSSFPASQPQAEGSPKATFFVLGWIAERLPHLVREIQSRGHEVASHGYNHHLCNQQSHADLKKELTDSKKLLEDITGSQVCGFRAPNFSINDDILEIIKGCSYLYDSSYNSFGLHSRYGKISLNGHAKKGIAFQISDNFFELPISNLNLWNPMSYVRPNFPVASEDDTGGKLSFKKHSEGDLTGQLLATSKKRNDENRFVLPLGGGGYFRLLPFSLFKLGVQSTINKNNTYLMYLHPWEIDPEQPRVTSASLNYKFKHYINLSKTHSRLNKLIKSFQDCCFIACREYLKSADG